MGIPSNTPAEDDTRATGDSKGKEGARQVESGAKQTGEGIEDTAKGIPRLDSGDARRRVPLRSRVLPYASINFVTAHAGFTLNDPGSYYTKHNEANGDGNRDDHDHNLSWNHGAEGGDGRPAIVSFARDRRETSWPTLLLSQDMPMILPGDEIRPAAQIPGGRERETACTA